MASLCRENEQQSEQPDIMICGKCNVHFSDILNFLEHKRSPSQCGLHAKRDEPRTTVTDQATTVSIPRSTETAATRKGPVEETKTVRTSAAGNGAKRSRTSRTVYRCPQHGCAFTSMYSKDVRRHHRTHTGEKPFACGTCGTQFSREDKLRVHERIHLGQRPYQCGLCNYSAVDSGNLHKHMRSHTDERPYKCQLCSYAAKSQSQMTTHLRSHTGDAPFTCPCSPCTRAFKTRSDLKRHIRLHTGEKPFLCHLCEYRCAVASNLKSHIRLMHGSGAKRHKCSQCKYSAASAKTLLRHVKLSHEGTMSCDVCDFTATGKHLLQQHIKEQHLTKPYLCKFCQQAFMQLHILRSHVRKEHENPAEISPSSGSGENVTSVRILSSRAAKPFACTQCRARFVREDSLKSHLKAHSEPPPHGYAPISTKSSVVNAVSGQNPLSEPQDAEPLNYGAWPL